MCEMAAHTGGFTNPAPSMRERLRRSRPLETRIPTLSRPKENPHIQTEKVDEANARLGPGSRSLGGRQNDRDGCLPLL